MRPYASDTGRDVFNDNDNIYDANNTLKLSEDGEGYLGLITYIVRSA